jgi:hypothetical protein
MIKGSILPVWTEDDYINLPWFENESHEEKFNATVDTKLYDVGVLICNENLPRVFYNILSFFNIDKPVVAVNKLTPGRVLPYHRDKFATYIKRNNINDTDTIVRYIVFLHEQKAGHQLWIEDQFCTGDAGSYFGWEGDSIHMAANLGWEDRYILQITGVKRG